MKAQPHISVQDNAPFYFTALSLKKKEKEIPTHMQHRTEINIKQLIFFSTTKQNISSQPHPFASSSQREKISKGYQGVKNGANTLQSLLHILFSVS